MTNAVTENRPGRRHNGLLEWLFIFSVILQVIFDGEVGVDLGKW